MIAIATPRTMSIVVPAAMSTSLEAADVGTTQ